MNDSGKSYPMANAETAKPQWLDDDEQPVVGRIVHVAATTYEGKTTSGETAASLPNASGEHDNPNQNAITDEPLGKIGRSRLAILTTVFVVAGVLGVPLIVYSPVFSRLEKVFWSIVATLYSGVLLYILYRVIVWFLDQI